MKKSFHVFFLFTLMAFFATVANAQDAQEVNLEQDGTGEWFVNMPNELDDGYAYFTLTIPQNVESFKVYDNGGKLGDYGDYGEGKELEIIAPEGSSLELSGTVNTADEFDVLIVNDGNFDNNDYVDQYYGENVTIGSIISSGNAFTLNFGTDEDGFASGFDLTINVVKGYEVAVENVAGGMVSSNKTNAKEGDNVVLTVAPEAGYVLSGISIVADDVPVATSGCAQWYDCDNTVSFTMPAKGVTVTPVFTQSPSVNIPTDGTRLNVNVPATANTFKVHVGDYASAATGDLGLIAPEGYVFYVGGLNAATMGNALEIQDSTIFGKKCVWGGACQTDATIFPSYGSTVVLKLNTDEANFDLDLTVTLVSAGATKLRAISVADGVVGGSVEITPAACATYGAAVGNYVTLTATPAENYVLDHIAVVDSFGNALAMSATHWYAAGPVDFSMPATPVTITPVFTNDFSELSIDMPTTGTKTVEIPAGVTTFKLYDDGGKDGNYSDNANGSLRLTAPEGYVFELQGSMVVQVLDRLTVEDVASGNNLEIAENGTVANIGPVYSTGNTIVVNFKSDEDINFSGFEFAVSVVQISEHEISVASVNGGTMSSSADNSLPGAPITLTAKPADGYYLSEVLIEDEDSQPIYVEGGKWYTNDTAAFVMPNKDVTVTPVFVQGTPFVNMPTAMRDGITIMVTEKVTEFKIYDNGGAVGNYSDNIDGTVEMQVPAGYMLRISGTLDSEEDNDLLSLYSERNTIWDRLSGNQTLGPFETDESFALRFSSNGSVNASGLDITVTLTPKASQTVTLASGIAGAVTFNGTPISAGSSVEISQDAVVNLNITPNDGYMLNGVDVVGKDGNSVQVSGGEWYSNNAASFTMPGQSVTVTPVLVRTEDVTELAIKMPSTMQNLLEVNLPEDWTTYKIYDDGGKDGHANGGGMLVLAAPAGKVLMVSGNVTFGEDGEFGIYDGRLDMYNYGERPELLKSSYVSSDIASVVSTGNVITINFMFYATMFGGVGDNDLDLTVMVMDAPEPNNVELVQKTGGTVEASVSEASLGETVTITIDCDDTYLLDGISVVDEGGNPVAVTGGHWYEGSASFKMPMTAVTVTPSFSQGKKSVEDGLFINLPLMTGMGAGMGYPTANIPEGVKSFKVYDDGGADANYTANAQEIMQLNAPSGYLLRVTGSVDLGEGARLYVNPDESSNQITGVESDIGSFEGSEILLALTARTYVMDGQEHAGLDLTVELVKTTQYAAVTVEQVGTKTTATIDGVYNDNDAVNIPEEIEVDEVVFNRTFSTAGYSTITLPFAIDVNKVDGLAHAYEFDAMGIDANGKKEVRMLEVNSLAANTPYIIEVADETLVFHGEVTVEATQAPVVKKGDWEFRGTLQKKTWSAGDEDLGRVYGYSAEATDKVTIGQFVKAAAGAWIRPLRAYLIYNPEADGVPEDGSALHKSAGSTLGAAEPLPDYIDVVVVSRDANGQEHKKVIGVIDTRTGEFKMMQDYDLKGRKLMNGQQKARGAYYGKKEIIK